MHLLELRTVASLNLAQLRGMGCTEPVELRVRRLHLLTRSIACLLPGLAHCLLVRIERFATFRLQPVASLVRCVQRLRMPGDKLLLQLARPRAGKLPCEMIAR